MFGMGPSTTKARLGAVATFMVLVTLVLPTPAVGAQEITIDDQTINPPNTDVALSASPSQLSEADSATTITVTATRAATAPTNTTVAVTLSFGGTASAADYTATTPSDITINPGDTSATTTLTITPTDDTDVEDDETIVISGTGTATTVTPTTITLTDNDTAAPEPQPDPVSNPKNTDVALSASPSQLSEADSATTITVTATRAATAPTNTTVAVTLSFGGTASAADYTATTPSDITINPGDTSATTTLTITPTDDTDVEDDETIVISGTGTATTATPTTITLTDNDTAAPEPQPDPVSNPKNTDVALSASPSQLSEADSATTITVTATRAATAPTNTTVAVTLSFGGTASAADYTATTPSDITINPGDTSATTTLTITPTDDTDVEDDETIVISGTGTATTATPTTITLTDNDTEPTNPPNTETALFLPVQETKAEALPETAESNLGGKSTSKLGSAYTDSGCEGVRVKFTLWISPTPTSDHTFHYSTVDGTATAGTDYTAVEGSVTFPSGDSSNQLVYVQTTRDNRYDNWPDTRNETFYLEIKNADKSKTVTKPKFTLIDDCSYSITLDASVDAVGEGDEAAGVTVTATRDITSGAVDLSLSLGGTAADSDDYTTTDLPTIQFSEGADTARGTFSLTPADDELVEGTETIVVTGSANGYGVGTATIDLTDDETATVAISGPSEAVAEGETATFTVTLSEAVTSETSVDWATSTDSGNDWSPDSGTVTFPANSAAGATQTISVRVTDDKLSEGEETLTVTLGSISGNLADSVSIKTGEGSATATISASDPITVSVSGPRTVGEGGSGSYTISLSPSGVTPTANLEVDYATSDGTATAGSDYTATSGSITFTAEDPSSQTVTVQTTADSVDDPGETFTLNISDPKGGGATPSLGTSSVTTAIQDVEGIYLSASPATLGEVDDATTVRVTAIAVGDLGEVNVTLSLAGTATLNTDYAATALSALSVDSSSGTLESTTFDVTPTDDDVFEGTETIVISGTADDGTTVTSASLSLTDDDAPELSLTGPGALVEGETATFTVTLSKTVGSEVSVDWATGTDSGDDWSPDSGTVTFPANSAAGATQTFSVTVTDDMLSEGAEKLDVAIESISGDQADDVSIKSGAGSADAIIAASDPITMIVGSAMFVPERGAAAFTIYLSPTGVIPTTDMVRTYSTVDNTAKAGEDYTAVSGTVTFTQTDPGAKVVLVPISHDSLKELGERFDFVVKNADGTRTLSTSETYINDDDDNQVVLSASIDTIGEADGATSVEVTATRGTTFSQPRTVTLSLSGTAARNADYTNTALPTITIPVNDASASATFTLTPRDEGRIESDETIVIEGTSDWRTVAPATITLTDNDAARLRITGPESEVSEGETATFTVMLTKTVMSEISVDWATGTDSGADWSPDSGAVTFPANSPSGATQTISIAVTGDTLPETLTVTLGSISGDLADQVSISPGQGSATATLSQPQAPHETQDVPKPIPDPPADPTPPPSKLSLSGPSAPVREGESVTLTVTLTARADKAILASWQTTPGTATAADFSPTQGDVVFQAGSPAQSTQTITISVTDDYLPETAEKFSVSLDGSQVNVTIAESDPITVNVVGPAEVTEGQTATYTISLDKPPTTPLTVRYATADATSGQEQESSSNTPTYTPTQGTATFPAGVTTLTVDVQTMDDTRPDPDRSYTFELESPKGGGGPAPLLGNAVVTTAIADNDTEPQPVSNPSNTKVALSVSPSQLSEADSATRITVTATRAASAPTDTTVGVTLTVAGTATAADYTATTPTAITINAGDSSATSTFTITPTDDTDVEPKETIVISGTGTGITATPATITLTDNDTAPQPEPAPASGPEPVSNPSNTKVALSVSPSQLSEADSATRITVTATRAASAPTDTTVGVTLTVAGTATAADYTATTPTAITINAGDSSATSTFTITPTDDTDVEPKETIVISGTGTGITATPATITLTDNDTAPQPGPAAEPDPARDPDYANPPDNPNPPSDDNEDQSCPSLTSDFLEALADFLETMNSQAYMVNTSIEAIVLPGISESDCPQLTYSVTGLPPGLTFDPDTRTIDGAITGPAGTYTVTYTVTTTGNQQVTLILTITATENDDGSETEQIATAINTGGSTPGPSSQGQAGPSSQGQAGPSSSSVGAVTSAETRAVTSAETRADFTFPWWLLLLLIAALLSFGAMEHQSKRETASTPSYRTGYSFGGRPLVFEASIRSPRPAHALGGDRGS